LVAAALLAAGNIAHAQEAPAPADTRPALAAALRVSFPLLPVPPIAEAASPAQEPQAAPPAQDSTAQPVDRRDAIKTLETVFTLAVKSGADKLALQMRASEPGSLFLIDTGRTRGFVIEGYGVFFDVDVPMMKQSYLYVTRQLTQQETRAQLENNIANLPPGMLRDFAVRELRRMDQQAMRQPGVASATQIANPGVVTGQVVDTPAAAADPNELYTQAVKTAIIDAMLNYSVGLKLGADEWLAVAARDAQGAAPGQPEDASTIVIRVRGSDLAAFHANKLTRDDVLKRVVVKEY